ncbi:response regulator [Halorhodospira halochloris]|uniref:Response regulator n=2 Tax=Halorhodospira halochloris TaxID=1052 RepID=A0A0X8X9C7_HALHR|nr:HD-GYP domain-containing protein [Halorhodospira halochloris]MBK1652545.1 hypothetical protein [Halorhodospira halochloris]BAU57871.1 response regulator [Halorhodospira halochloris]
MDAEGKEKIKDDKEISRIPVGELKPGMYLHDLGLDWLRHPFLTNSFYLDAPSINKIRQLGVDHVWIDESKKVEQDKVEEKNSEEAVRSKQGKRPKSKKVVPSLEQAQETTLEARETVQELFRGVYHQEEFPNFKGLQSTADELLTSVANNPAAMLSVGRLRTRDGYTYEHSVNCGVLMMIFASFYGLGEYHVRTLGIAGFLHDIGKVRVPNEILQKPGALTDEEFTEIKKHSSHGYQILKDTPGIPEKALEVARLHHERVDGKGYPDALPESKIPFEARLAAIVDVYDALTAVRCYKDGMTPTQALRQMMAEAGAKFDQNLFKRFIKCIGVYPPGSIVRLSNGQLGVVENVSRENSAKPIVRVVYDIEREEHIDPPRVINVSRENGLSVISSESLTDWAFLEERLLVSGNSQAHVNG